MTESIKSPESLHRKKRELLELLLKEKRSVAPVSNKIPRRPQSPHAPLSFAQEQMWFLDQLNPGSSYYNLPVAIRFKGKLDVAALELTINEILRRHEVLRTTYDVIEGKPVQIIHEALTRPLPIVDLSSLEAGERESAAQRMRLEEGRRPFDLKAGPIIRSKILRLSEDEHALLLTMHHICTDGWSMGVIYREMGALYEAFSARRPSPLLELLVQYADYAVWQRRRLQDEGIEESLSFWRRQLKDAAVGLELPTDKPRQSIQSHDGGVHLFDLPLDLSRALQSFSQREGVTLPVTLLAAFKALLFRYTHQNDILIGMPVVNRPRPEIENLIGMFLNTFILRTEVQGAESFRTLVTRVRETVLAAHDHQELPIEKLVEELQPDRDLSHNPLFQVMFNFMFSKPSMSLPGLVLNTESVYNKTSKFDLELNLWNEEDRLSGDLEYSSDLFEAETITRLCANFQQLLSSAVASPDDPVAALPIVSAAERRQFAAGFGAGPLPGPETQCWHELFERRAAHDPSAIALTCGDLNLSYGALERRSSQAASVLSRRGVRPETVVALLSERAPEMVIWMLAAHRAGGAYLPLDPNWPTSRLAQALRSSAPVVLVSSAGLETTSREALAEAGCGAHLLVMGDEGEGPAGAEVGEIRPQAALRNLAYIIYTSGSTGEPKGAMLTHAGLLNHLRAKVEDLNLNPSDVVAQTASQCFDISVWQMWAPLLVGGSIRLVPDEIAHDPSQLLVELDRSGVTVAELVPSVLGASLDHLEGTGAESHSLTALRWLLVTGETLPPELCRRWLRRYPSAPMMNAYGPTECSDDVTHGIISVAPEEQVRRMPIGRALRGIRLHVVDSRGALAPIGVIGELLCGGAGVGRGYVSRPDLTAERFAPDPFSIEAGPRLYRTGDLARWLPDGRLEFLGRIDHQVKVRGFRIELAEIEAVLRRHEAVGDAAVVAREDPGATRLVAYVVGRGSGAAPVAAELREWLGSELPSYMTPSTFVALDSLPLTENGKLDRKALPEPEAVAECEPTAPRTSVEEILAGIWAAALRLERVGVEENFFGLGGHSLLATQVITRVRQYFGVDLPLRSLFESPTVAGLARRIEVARGARADAVALPALAPVAGRGTQSPLSFAQQRLWFLAQFEGASEAYHIAGGIRLKGELDQRALRRALDRIVERHEALRTTFSQVDGRPVQVIGPRGSGFLLREEDLRDSEDAECELRRLAEQEVTERFDLEEGPLIRGRLARLGEDEHALLLTMHHIVSDGWSTGILVDELSALYGAYCRGEGEPLKELAVQYADYAEWQRQWLKGAEWQRQAEYWKRELGGAPQVLELPADRPRLAEQDYAGAVLEIELGEELTRKLKALSRRQGVTLYMTLLASWGALLGRLSGGEEVVIGTPVANRRLVEIEGLIGFFVNMLAIRVDLSAGPTVEELLIRVKERTMEGQEHQDFPFEQVVEMMQPLRSLSHAPVFQVMFVWENTPKGELSLPGLTMTSVAAPPHLTTQFDLSLLLREKEQQIVGVLEYATALFERETVRRYVGYWVRLLEGMAADEKQTVDRLPLLSDEERRQVLEEWNATEVEYPREKCIHELFEEQVSRTPGMVAVVYEEQEMTYQELNERANQLAHYLKELGVGPEARVGIGVERSPEMIVSLLGVLKAGGAYVPIDPDYPTERLAFMMEDSQAAVFLTKRWQQKKFHAQTGLVVFIDDCNEIRHKSKDNLDNETKPNNSAYVIYTSGSTGQPKGVVVEHRNVVNFFAGMDQRIGSDSPGVWLAVTSISFDISVFELFWTLIRGFKVVLSSNRERSILTAQPTLIDERKHDRMMDFSLFYFASNSGNGDEDKYRMLLEGANLADHLGFSAIWTPERHFHAFGGLYPNPSVTSAAIAAITKRIQIRAGSVVLPLHSPIRVAEEWALVDNLSKGRVGISFASGWHDRDFVFEPGNYAGRKDVMFSGIETVRKLWRGESITCQGGIGTEVEVKIFPQPIRRELPIWITAAGNPETFRMAGERGFNLLTHLLGQNLEELAGKIAIYREAWREGGHGAGNGHVTLMIHTYIGEDLEIVREKVRKPFSDYLRDSVDLIKQMALAKDLDVESLSEDDMDALLSHAFDRYFETSGLFGTAESCLEMIERLKNIGVDEVACLIDFGIDVDSVLSGLSNLNKLRELSNERERFVAPDYSIAEQIRNHDVSHLQCTPSFARMFTLDQEAFDSLGSIRKLILGGEALPGSLVEELSKVVTGEIYNMYGPTETTVWSTTYLLRNSGATIPIGRPIANTGVYILDRRLQPVPVGVTGELFIGNAGVVRGYLNRPDLTTERFVANPYGEPGTRMYRTGDLARWRVDGNLEFLGRTDQQVKIRGHRIELEEIETVLRKHPEVIEAVVAAREDEEGEKRLVAYVVSREETAPSHAKLLSFLKERLPEYMTPAAIVVLEALPLTPNGKLDRKALPAPDGESYARRDYEPPVGRIERKLARIWAELLKVERVGRRDNFFELGGHSLLAVWMIQRMRREGLRGEVRTLFTAPTLQALAEAIEGATWTEVEVPPNLIPEGCERITPEMVSLAELRQEEIDAIVAGVDGGASNIQDIYPLAPLQEGILFHHLMNTRGDAYLLQVLLAFDTHERLEKFVEALQVVIRRHDILRTAVVWEGLPEPVQVVWREAPLDVEEVTLDRSERGAAIDAARQLRERFDPRHIRLDVRRAPLMRCYVAHDAAVGRWLLLWLSHHLAVDHTTFDIMVEEAQSCLLGEADRLPEPLPFRNFVAQARLGVSQAEHEEFFRKMLGGVDEPTAPFGLLDVRGDGSGLEDARIELEAALCRRLREKARELGVSVASLCHLAWGRALGRISGREDVVFGTVVFGRMQGGEGADRVLGLFINTLPMRIRVGEEGVRRSVREVHELLARLMRHEHASLALAQRCSGVPTPTPLFSALFNYRHSPREAELPAEAALAWDGIEGLSSEEWSNYPLLLTVDDLGDGFALTAQTATSIDPWRVCGYMRTALEGLVEALEGAPETAVREIEVMPEAERRCVLEEWNATEAEYPKEKCIHELFQEQVERSPEAIALVYEEQSLSYAELNRRANRLTHHLRELGVGPDVRVAICMQRSIEMMVALLATLKAGGAYVPLDPDYPPERIAHMLEDSAPAVLLTHGASKAALARHHHEICVVDLDADAPSWAAQIAHNPDRASIGLDARCLAYVIYTSGSTGLPKGVMVEHSGLCNLAFAQSQDLAVDPASHVLQSASFSFDGCIFQVMMALCRGALLVLPPHGPVLAGEELAQFVDRYDVSHAALPPAVLASLPRDVFLNGVSTLIVAGEAVTRELVQRWSPGRRMINDYGPTEATVSATHYDCRGDELGSPPIGRPIANKRIYILDKRHQPAPVKAPGEIYLGGAGVARGYLNQPKLTAARFLPDPFTQEPGARMYESGDLGRWAPDGNIEFLGRNDFQVKIRGFRVELGEIEAALSEHPRVHEAVVLARQDSPGEKRLVAYLVCDREQAPTAGEARAFLKERLPEYMVPSAFVPLNELPLSPNGKVDRRALPAPNHARPEGSAAHVAPRTPTEEVIAAIWSQALGIESVGVYDNFFELGGHSLLVTRVVSRVREAFGIELPLRVIFESPVLAEYASSIELQIQAGSELDTIPLETISRDQPIPLSLSQQEMLAQEQMNPGTASNNVPLLIRLSGELDLTALEWSLGEIIRRHEILRTTFETSGGVARQIIHPPAPIQIPVVKLTGTSISDRETYARRLAYEEGQRPFDLGVGPLVRARVMRLSADEHLLLLVIHHIVIDPWSLSLFMRELTTLCGVFGQGEREAVSPLPDLPVQFADYAVWQRKWLQGEVLKRLQNYWRERLGGRLPSLNLPRKSKARRRSKMARGATCPVELPASLSGRIKTLSLNEGATPFISLLAALKATLYLCTGNTDIIVTSPMANRHHLEVESLIGFFANSVALRTTFDEGASFRELLRNVRETALGAYMRQALPLEKVLEALGEENDLSENPIGRVNFALLTLPVSQQEMGKLGSQIIDIEVGVASSALALTLLETSEGFRGKFTYRTDMFDKKFVHRMAEQFQRLLQSVVSDPDQILCNLNG